MAENINVEEYVFQLELEEETTKIKEKEETRSSNAMDVNMIFGTISQMSAQMFQMSTQISTQEKGQDASIS